MKILVIDCQGGGIGKALISKIKEELKEAEVIAVGTNAMATSTMLKSNPNAAATGENAIIYNAGKLTETDFILGPIGIIAANSMYGEVSPAIAHAVSASEATSLLIPVARCKVHVAGTQNMSLENYISDIIQRLKTF